MKILTMPPSKDRIMAALEAVPELDKLLDVDNPVTFDWLMRQLKNVEHLDNVPLAGLQFNRAKALVEPIGTPNRIAAQYMRENGISNIDTSAGAETYSLALDFLRGKVPALEKVENLIKRNFWAMESNSDLFLHVWQNSVHAADGVGMPSWLMQTGWSLGVLSYIKHSITEAQESGPIHPAVAKIHAHILHKLTEGREGELIPRTFPPDPPLLAAH